MTSSTLEGLEEAIAQTLGIEAAGRIADGPVESGKQPDHEGRPAATVSVVIVTYNSASVLPSLLDSLPEGLAGIERFEVIVVDNDSRDGSAELAEAHPLGPSVRRMGRNAGYAAAINVAAATVYQDSHILILNPDLRLCPGAVAPLVERAAMPSVGIAVPRNYGQDGKTDPTQRREPSILTAWAEAILGGKLAARLGWGEVISEPTRYECAGPVEWATGAALLVSARARRAVGGWDESFFLYSEEVDYQRRVRKAGFEIVYEPRSQVIHAGGESGTDPRLFALMTANKIRYYQRHHGPLQTALFRLAIAVGEAARSCRGSIHRAGLRSAVMPLKQASDSSAR
ncbi:MULTISPECIES: glycosyltransferase family 2 protein [unclassified Sinorhizobium]|uniref:glycosyltransferase family 2 protein n=1 Tax=unclassified Sinorhizobium TaxID=2613772 RepID=UPI0024C35B99|nr:MULTISPECIES: glycosyltransferase family 2 protein [unclassified Sinorhizobium]MDK1374009.1 glycosyltransferase family 2 protein [Sinorhizobium sp. 6-70]MDK1477422.1 glycosyltransferase family 2 protein [Sinorhizobium sp. 6-117]